MHSPTDSWAVRPGGGAVPTTPQSGPGAQLPTHPDAGIWTDTAHLLARHNASRRRDLLRRYRANATALPRPMAVAHRNHGQRPVPLAMRPASYSPTAAPTTSTTNPRNADNPPDRPHAPPHHCTHQLAPFRCEGEIIRTVSQFTTTNSRV